MRFLKTLTLNRRAIYDSRVALDTSDNFTLADSLSLILPKNSTSIGSPVEGQIRYNTATHEVQVYQGADNNWRSLRFKESTAIVQQDLGGVDGFSYFYGPLNASYDPTNKSSNVPNTGGEGAGQYGGQNILVIVENVIQIYNTNYIITQNPTAGVATTVEADDGTTTLTFASTATIPTGSVVTGHAYLQPNTVATVTSENTVTLSHTISGGNIPLGTPITFTAPTGYYLNFTSDPFYFSLGGKVITVLHGFDR